MRRKGLMEHMFGWEEIFEGSGILIHALFEGEGGAGAGGDKAGDKAGDKGGDKAEAKVFTQEQVNSILADHKRGLQDSNKALETQLTGTTTELGVLKEQLTALQT